MLFNSLTFRNNEDGELSLIIAKTWFEKYFKTELQANQITFLKTNSRDINVRAHNKI